jgi:hypothetical protein
MRRKILALVLLLACITGSSSRAKATTMVDLPFNGSVTLAGDISSQISIGIGLLLSYSPVQGAPFGEVSVGYILSTGLGSDEVYVSDGFCHVQCGGGTNHVKGGGNVQVSDFYRTISIDGNAFFLGEIVNRFELVIFLPDGLSIAAPVPEPSTWAMLLIGFAGIGFATYRRSRKSPRQSWAEDCDHAASISGKCDCRRYAARCCGVTRDGLIGACGNCYAVHREA